RSARRARVRTAPLRPPAAEAGGRSPDRPGAAPHLPRAAHRAEGQLAGDRRRRVAVEGGRPRRRDARLVALEGVVAVTRETGGAAYGTAGAAHRPPRRRADEHPLGRPVAQARRARLLRGRALPHRFRWVLLV